MDQQLITSPAESWTMSSKSAVKEQRPEKPRVSLWISSRRRSMMSKAWRVGCCFCYLDDDHRWARSWKVMFLEILDFLEFCSLVFLIFFVHRHDYGWACPDAALRDMRDRIGTVIGERRVIGALDQHLSLVLFAALVVTRRKKEENQYNDDEQE
ncbi:uncharacterized protein LOC120279329 [Dioscorea cayenensis subsp. rotundata]|uniref:Uncharacterized protein LOC120279329 n=1 Tax=Dioscorea cayennensis subsp. rotundata TaxID=55577 RepID=A0AB40CVV4_DIOCR|nr:uncharacterized protein LOC120279329 [Dioscorea cayenensis subsp. rotundata]